MNPHAPNFLPSVVPYGAGMDASAGPSRQDPFMLNSSMLAATFFRHSMPQLDSTASALVSWSDENIISAG